MVPRHPRMAKTALWTGIGGFRHSRSGVSTAKPGPAPPRRQGQASWEGLWQPHRRGQRLGPGSGGPAERRVLRSFIGTPNKSRHSGRIGQLLERFEEATRLSRGRRSAVARHRSPGGRSRREDEFGPAYAIQISRSTPGICTSGRIERRLARSPKMTSEYGGLRQQAHAGPRGCDLRRRGTHFGYVAPQSRLAQSLSRVSPTPILPRPPPPNSQRSATPILQRSNASVASANVATRPTRRRTTAATP